MFIKILTFQSTEMFLIEWNGICLRYFSYFVVDKKWIAVLQIVNMYILTSSGMKDRTAEDF